MVRYKELGFKSFNDFVNHFFNTLLPSNKTYEYFVDWKKVKNAVNKYLEELSLLNSLTKIPPKHQKDHLHHLLKKYPKTIEVIPMLIAERIKNGKIDILDPEIEEFISFNFQCSQTDDATLREIVSFCDKTGIINLFGEIKDIHDYLLGIEVGLDSNARKNRSGDIFENMVRKKVKTLLGNEYQIVNNDPNFSLYPILSKGRSKGKTHDLVVYLKKKPLLIIECNFYNVTGSKPVSIAESYPEMHRVAKQHGVEFLWVTDGPAWHKMKEPLLRAMRSMEWIFNFKMLKHLPKIIKTFSIET